MILKSEMIEILEQLKNFDLTKDVILNNPNIKFKITLKNKLIDDGFQSDDIKSFLKVLKVKIKEEIIEDEDIMTAALDGFSSLFGKLLAVAKELNFSFEDILDVTGNDIEFVYE